MQAQPDSERYGVVNSAGQVETPDQIPAAPTADPSTFHADQTPTDLGAQK